MIPSPPHESVAVGIVTRLTLGDRLMLGDQHPSALNRHKKFGLAK
jgi:hypothetical protein